ncbi:HNH endonuclease [Rossellomorea vietnamensis]|uniref:Putative HNH nuclease YajD n=1 Tax=Rossellomorea vietnamensis TaxID=218284 RepID=A0A5D4NJ57_9BACI|nr:HNH endonuclease signature motif containing protein [Rossellomorea vietnamensis]TYS14283.1 HNH endonuclease [Rossellomorea vietnamensis]
MRYCGEQGCKTLISSGRYCPNHKRKKKEKAVYSKNKSFYNTQAWKDLKAYCYERDKGCCQRCGKFVFGKRAHHHHKVPISVNPSLKLSKRNVITLCPRCHMIVENEGKTKKNTGFDWKL